MAKVKVSQWDSTAANNTDINSININEGCPPSTINNAIREVMAQIKDWQDGSSGDNWTSTGTITSNGSLEINGSLYLDGNLGTNGQVLVSVGSTATPVWGNAFIAGMIMLWTGSVAPSGWALCNGGSGTPDLRDKFVIGAGGSQPTTGGYADATLVSHTHAVSGTAAASSITGTAAASSVSGTTGAGGTHNHSASTTVNTKTGLNGTLTLINRGGTSGSSSLMANSSGSIVRNNSTGSYGAGWKGEGGSNSSTAYMTIDHNHSASTTIVAVGNHTHTFSGTAGASSVTGTAAASGVTGTAAATGIAATNRNLPPYYALAYIMKI